MSQTPPPGRGGAGEGGGGGWGGGLPPPAAAGAPAATAAAAAAEATATATTAAAPVASAACPGGLCLLDLDGPAVEARAVEPADGLLGFLRRRHLDEAEAPRPAGVPVGHDARGFDAAGRREGLAQTLVRGGKCKTADEEFHRHGRAPSDRTETIGGYTGHRLPRAESSRGAIWSRRL